jgi:hypothetical protein
MNQFIIQLFRFLVFVLVQALIFNQLELGWGIHPMIYPLFLLFLPFEINIVFLLLIAFTMGLCIDSISNTYGLHTSALLFTAYLRPYVYKLFAPREGYDLLKEGTIPEMGQRWFFYVFGMLLFLHHLWFFTLEMFNIHEFFFILKKTVLSAPASFLLCVLLQILFVSKTKSK